MSGFLSSGIVNATAIPDTLIDNFEDDPDGIYGSSETTADYYSGSPSVFDRTTTNVTEGSQALKHDGTSGIAAMYSQPGDGLNNYPSEGDTVEWIHYTDSAVVAGPMVAASAGVDGYLYDLHPGANDIQIWRFDNGSVRKIGSTSQSISSGAFFWCEGRVPSSLDDTLTLEMYNIDTADNSRGSLINSATANDSNHVGQGVGWGVVSTGDGTFADRLRVQ